MMTAKWSKQQLAAAARQIANMPSGGNFRDIYDRIATELPGLDPARHLRFHDWSGVDFSFCDLAGFDLSGSNVMGCKFRGSQISDARLNKVIIDHVSLYAGANIGVHDQQHSRMSLLRQADDWNFHVDFMLINKQRIFRALWLLERGTVSLLPKTKNEPLIISDGHLFTGTVFQDAPFAPEMVMLAPGTFMMGSPDDDPKVYENEKPQHEVTISQRFAMGRYPVTFEEWDVFADDTDGYRPDDNAWGRGHRPVINVSWKDAQNYIKWLNAKTYETYRLPTEAEWEYACRAGVTTRYSYGDSISDQQANKERKVGKTTAVGAYLANGFGLFDMHGNVWEWCSDWYGREYYRNSPPMDPKGPTLSSNRTYRGGGWSNSAGSLGSAVRSYDLPDNRGLYLGFRLLRQVM